MKARVKQDYRWKTVTAFGGKEFTKGEWRKVPAGFEEFARRHEALETDEVKEEPKKQDEVPTAEALLKEIVNKELIEVQDKKSTRRTKKE